MDYAEVLYLVTAKAVMDHKSLSSQPHFSVQPKKIDKTNFTNKSHYTEHYA